MNTMNSNLSDLENSGEWGVEDNKEINTMNYNLSDLENSGAWGVEDNKELNDEPSNEEIIIVTIILRIGPRRSTTKIQENIFKYVISSCQWQN